MDAEARRRERQRALAQALMGAQAPQGQMAGGFYVAPNPLERLATLGSQWAGGRLNRRLDKEDAQAEAAERQRIADTLRRLGGGGAAPGGEQGPQMRQATIGGMPPEPPQDPRQAAAMEAFQTLPLEAQRQVVAGRALETMFPKAPKIERVDAGDSIVLLDEAGREVGRLPKGATPDAVLGQEGQDRRHLTPSGNARLTADTTRRGQDLSYGAQMRGQDITMRGQDLSAQTAAERLALDREKAAPEDKAAQVEQTWNMYETARAGLMKGLEGSSTGPFAGRIPAVTAGQQTAEGGVAAMAPVLKQLFRVAGEGVFTDRDQALLLDMVPKRTDRDDAREAKMANIDAIVRAKLGLPPLEPTAPQQPTGPTLSEGAMRYLDLPETGAGR